MLRNYKPKSERLAEYLKLYNKLTDRHELNIYEFVSESTYTRSGTRTVDDIYKDITSMSKDEFMNIYDDRYSYHYRCSVVYEKYRWETIPNDEHIPNTEMSKLYDDVQNIIQKINSTVEILETIESEMNI